MLLSAINVSVSIFFCFAASVPKISQAIGIWKGRREVKGWCIAPMMQIIMKWNTVGSRFCLLLMYLFSYGMLIGPNSLTLHHQNLNLCVLLSAFERAPEWRVR